MAETEEASGTATIKTHRGSRLKFILLIVLVLALIGGWYACPWILKLRSTGETPDRTETQARLSEIERRVDALEGKMASAGVKTVEIESEQPAPVEAPNAPAVDVARLQSDMVSLSAAVSGVQAELKQARNADAHRAQAAQSSLAGAIAFIELRDAVDAGRGFASELSALRAAARSDSGLEPEIAKLEPLASKGVASMGVLRADFLNLESGASAGIDKAAAQNWRQRIWAEMKSLVTVRSLHGNETADAFTETENALSAGDLSKALAAEANLPQAAQDVLKDWRAKAEERLTAETALHAIADHYITLAAPAALESP
jgi:hypothetical protein